MQVCLYLLLVLHVAEESPQSLPFVPFALVTVIFLHIIVAVVYHTKRKKVRRLCNSGRMQVCLYLLLVLHVAEGCPLKDPGKTEEITAYTGGCRAQRQGQMGGCETKTEWRRDQETQNEVLFATVNEDQRNKVKETDDCEVLYAAVNEEDKSKKVEENQDGVTYSTVVHNKRSTPATVLLDTEKTTEYASIKLN
ncbi:hypothetical protein MHYP_G00050560 [Metynnis hypsauchen]